MREVPRRPPATTVPILLLAFFGGGGAGLGLAALLAPGSQTASFVSFLLFPTILIGGFHAWLGLAILILAPRLLLRLIRGRHRRRAVDPSREVAPPGEWVFLPLGSAAALAVGVLVDLLSRDQPGGLVAAAYWAAGSLYGGLLALLARKGFLPFPESD